MVSRLVSTNCEASYVTVPAKWRMAKAVGWTAVNCGWEEWVATRLAIREEAEPNCWLSLSTILKTPWWTEESRSIVAGDPFVEAEYEAAKPSSAAADMGLRSMWELQRWWIVSQARFKLSCSRLRPLCLLVVGTLAPARPGMSRIPMEEVGGKRRDSIDFSGED